MLWFWRFVSVSTKTPKLIKTPLSFSFLSQCGSCTHTFIVIYMNCTTHPLKMLNCLYGGSNYATTSSCIVVSMCALQLHCKYEHVKGTRSKINVCFYVIKKKSHTAIYTLHPSDGRIVKMMRQILWEFFCWWSFLSSPVRS